MKECIMPSYQKKWTIAKNPKARHDYAISEYLHAGMVLQGWEAKAIRQGRISIKESFISIAKREAWIKGAHISPPSGVCTHHTVEPYRDRKLLLSRKEIDHCTKIIGQKGFTMVPLEVFCLHARFKVEIGIGKGKKAYDKREVEKKRDWDMGQRQLFKKRWLQGAKKRRE